MEQDLFEHNDFDTFVRQADIALRALKPHFDLLVDVGDQITANLSDKICALRTIDHKLTSILLSDQDTLVDSIKRINDIFTLLSNEVDRWSTGTITIVVTYIDFFLAELLVEISVVIQACEKYNGGKVPADVDMDLILRATTDFQLIGSRIIDLS